VRCVCRPSSPTAVTHNKFTHPSWHLASGPGALPTTSSSEYPGVVAFRAVLKSIGNPALFPNPYPFSGPAFFAPIFFTGHTFAGPFPLLWSFPANISTDILFKVLALRLLGEEEDVERVIENVSEQKWPMRYCPSRSGI